MSPNNNEEIPNPTRHYYCQHTTTRSPAEGSEEKRTILHQTDTCFFMIPGDKSPRSDISQKLQLPLRESNVTSYTPSDHHLLHLPLVLPPSTTFKLHPTSRFTPALPSLAEQAEQAEKAEPVDGRIEE